MYTPQRNSTIAFGQIYVEHLTPDKVTQPIPLLLIHGHGMTGSNFLNTPDGRLGWADFFMSKGYEVYILDQPSRGRSPWQINVEGPQSEQETFTIESEFTATQNFNRWPQAALHTQWPGNGSVGDPIFDEFFASTVPSLISDIEQSQKFAIVGPQLLDKIGDVIAITHSQAGPLGWIIADARPEKIKGIVAIEPMGPPFIDAVFRPSAARPFGLTETPIEYSPPINSSDDLKPVVVSDNPALNFTCFLQASPARRLPNIARVPVLVVTSESSYHSIYDGCTVDYLKQAGVNVNHTRLPDVGIHGNGHMMFMEMNSLEIADRVVEKWVAGISKR